MARSLGVLCTLAGSVLIVMGSSDLSYAIIPGCTQAPPACHRAAPNGGLAGICGEDTDHACTHMGDDCTGTSGNVDCACKTIGAAGRQACRCTTAPT